VLSWGKLRGDGGETSPRFLLRYPIIYLGEGKRPPFGGGYPEKREIFAAKRG